MAPEFKTHAIFAVDPGGTTGVAAADVEVRPTRKEALATISRAKSIEVGGDWLEQAHTISAMMWRFAYRANVERSIPLPNIHFAFEDFILRRRQEGGATGNLTSCWVAAGAVAAYAETGAPLDNVAWQQPSSAKSLATDARLKDWGLWVVGSPHERDAWRHFVLRLDGLL
jgi:hypothetical protein